MTALMLGLLAASPSYAKQSASPVLVEGESEQADANVAIDGRVNAAHEMEIVPGAMPSTDEPVQPADGAQFPSSDGWRDLYLEVFINEKSTNLIGNFKESVDGRLAVEPAELTEVGLEPAQDALGSNGLVLLERLPGVTYRLDADNQRLYVNTTIEGRSSRQIDLGSSNIEERMAPVSGYGAVLNYSMFASTNDFSHDEDTDLLAGISGDFDARVFTPFGTVNQSFITGYTDGDLQGVTRLNTSWTYSDANRLLTYRAGDVVSGGLSWTRPVYMGGLQLQRNFSLRSDLVTLPLPSFRGTAAVPSILEVYTQNVQTYSGEVGEGPFQLDNLPIYAGAGEARVVLRDALGRETEASLPFYVSSNMLAKGLFDFSMDVGMPRRNFGIESFDYDERVYGVLTARYGLANWLTLEGHSEVGEDLINGGLGVTFPLLHYGALSVAAAGSHHEGQTGGLINAALELSHAGWTFFGRTQRTFGDYKDIAAVTARLQDIGTAGIPLRSFDVPRAIDQVALGVPMPLELSSLNLSYTHIEDADGEESQVVGASYSQQLFGNISAFATAFADIDDKDSYGAFAGISVAFDNNISASTAIDHGPSGTNFSAEVAKAELMQDGSFGWRIRTSEGETTSRKASGSYRSPWARFEAGIQQHDNDFRATAQVDGSIAVAGGDVFAANRIDDSFAIVDVGVPGVDVLYQNRKVGKSNARGKKLVTGLNSFEPATLAIDPASLPVDAQVTSTKNVVIPAGQTGVVVDFGVSDDPKAALVTFLDASGKPLEAGLDGQLETGGEFVVGYDGQAYITGLQGQNHVNIATGFEKSCSADFAYKPSKGEQVTIEGVRCE